MFQGGRDIDLLAAFRETVQHHIDKNVGARAAHSIAAVDHNGARTASVRLVDFTSELQERFGGTGHSVSGPRTEMELSDGASLACKNLNLYEVPRQYKGVQMLTERKF